MKFIKKIPIAISIVIMILALLFIIGTLVKHGQTADRVNDQKQKIEQEQQNFFRQPLGGKSQ